MKNIFILFKTFHSGFDILYFLVRCSENEKQKYFSQENPDQKTWGILNHKSPFFAQKLSPVKFNIFMIGVLFEKV